MKEMARDDRRLTLNGGLDGSDGNLGGGGTEAGRSVDGSTSDRGEGGSVLTSAKGVAASSPHSGALDDRHDR